MNSSSWKTVVGTALALFAASCAALEPVPEGADGLWRARRPGGNDQVRLDVYRGPVGHRDTERARLYFELDEIAGLDAAAFRAGPAPLEFRIERSAGTLVFSGTRARRPAGSFRLAPSAEFVESLERLDLDYSDRERLLDLAIYGVSLDLLEALLAAGYAGGDTGDLLRLQHYGLTPEWIASMARLEGPPTVGELLSLRHHGIQTRHVDRWIAAGIADRDVDELLRLHIHGFEAADGALYTDLGFAEIDEWLSFQRSGVPESLIVAVIESAAEVKDVDSIVGLYVHGIGAEGVRAAAPLIEAGFDWDALLGLWRRGVSSEYAAKLIETGWDLDEDDIARLAMNGLDREWVLGVRAASGDELDVDDLVELAHAGVRATDYESYVAHGYASVEDVRMLVAQGVSPGWLDRVTGYFAGRLSVDDVAMLIHAGVDESVLRRLTDAGIAEPDPEDVVEAVRTGVDAWIERHRP